MKSRSDLYYDLGNRIYINKIILQGDINLSHGVNIAFFLCSVRVLPELRICKKVIPLSLRKLAVKKYLQPCSANTRSDFSF